jgi:hypothetical protein
MHLNNWFFFCRKKGLFKYISALFISVVVNELWKKKIGKGKGTNLIADERFWILIQEYWREQANNKVPKMYVSSCK